jgi:predicted RNase H-like HicB family nuclease
MWARGATNCSVAAAGASELALVAMDSAVVVEITLPAVVHRDEEWWIADCPALDVCTQGRTREEALVNFEDAVVFFIESSNPTLAISASDC